MASLLMKVEHVLHAREKKRESGVIPSRKRRRGKKKGAKRPVRRAIESLLLQTGEGTTSPCYYGERKESPSKKEGKEKRVQGVAVHAVGPYMLRKSALHTL